MVPLDKKLQWVNVKQKHPDRYRHIQTLWSISRNYSGIFQTLSNPGIIRVVVYPEPWHIQNQKHIQNPVIFKNPVYSELWHSQNPMLIQTFTTSSIYDEAFCENSGKYFCNKSLSVSIRMSELIFRTCNFTKSNSNSKYVVYGLFKIF